ncbi:hypothetical protein FOIG_16129 [Fusarium odoratissimum NRRL 54006]|uniref:Uncharacterized protein n=2 Tax=Fusarium oxysporum species complex TaxID=171631 RepID=X0IP70_FUSO5|nr:uncharacterized protein FOIG_16129 [Fusarium odoratissimum NRRL 54006]EXL90667.1 hypothetical protein FOIG_16129 [Fusarium odoratissimum NRRL 54006]TXB97271.1 hypothetical protein FocTR4_00012099 [Fusarium oxysporum f. sp. cubense]
MAVTDSLVQRRQLQPSCWAADESSKYPAIVGGRYRNLSQTLCTFRKSSATCPFWTLIVFVEAIQKSTIYSRDAPVRFLRLPTVLQVSTVWHRPDFGVISQVLLKRPF